MRIRTWPTVGIWNLYPSELYLKNYIWKYTLYPKISLSAKTVSWNNLVAFFTYKITAVASAIKRRLAVE